MVDRSHGGCHGLRLECTCHFMYFGSGYATSAFAFSPSTSPSLHLRSHQHSSFFREAAWSALIITSLLSSAPLTAVFFFETNPIHVTNMSGTLKHRPTFESNLVRKANTLSSYGKPRYLSPTKASIARRQETTGGYGRRSVLTNLTFVRPISAVPKDELDVIKRSSLALRNQPYSYASDGKPSQRLRANVRC